MNKLETTQIITLLAGNFDSISKKDRAQKEIMINTWYECLKDLDFRLVQEAVKKTIMQSPYPPTIAEIRKNAIEIINHNTSKTALDAWKEAYEMISNGLYMTDEQFNKHSEEVKKFFGNVRQVSELAKTDADIVNTVTKGQFLKQYDLILQRKQEQKLLSTEMQNRVLELQYNAIKKIGE